MRVTGYAGPWAENIRTRPSRASPSLGASLQADAHDRRDVRRGVEYSASTAPPLIAIQKWSATRSGRRAQGIDAYQNDVIDLLAASPTARSSCALVRLRVRGSGACASQR